ncbi:MAG: hypothetical protein O7C67_20735 [Gammaproteobacteria bacterium]|nr:hypothetical protein [Gammaproteobacteria bacterium]
MDDRLRMLDKFLGLWTTDPTFMIAIIAIGFVGLWFGLILKGIGAGRREAALKKDVLEVKGSIPQLESTIRNREQAISRLEIENQSLSERTSELQRDVETKEAQSRTAVREARALKSELAVVKNVRGASDNLLLDGFEDETDEPVDSAMQARLDKTEALYEKLKSALINRDERIEELEAELENPSGEIPDVALKKELEDINESTETLRGTVTTHEATISRLQTQLSEAIQEKEMLSDLASRRSRSNRSLKDASAELQTRVPELEVEIEARDKTITDREASIKRLLNDLEQANNDKDAQQQEIVRFIDEIKAHHKELLERQSESASLQASIDQKDHELARVAEERAALNEAVTKLQTTLGERDQTIATQSNQIDKSEVELAQNTELREGAVAEVGRVAEHRAKELVNEIDAMRESGNSAQLEIKRLRAALEQSESWALKVKQSLSDREAELSRLEDERTSLAEARNGLELKLRDAARVREQAAQALQDRGQQAADADVRFDELTARCQEQANVLEQSKAAIKASDDRVAELLEELKDFSTRMEAERQELTRVIAEREELAQQLFDKENTTASNA